jgi:hypothetical protein
LAREDVAPPGPEAHARDVDALGTHEAWGDVMTKKPQNELSSLEGCRVSLALKDGSRIDDCELISAGRNRMRNVWLFTNGTDTFLPTDDIVDLWAVTPTRSRVA